MILIRALKRQKTLATLKCRYSRNLWDISYNAGTETGEVYNHGITQNHLCVKPSITSSVCYILASAIPILQLEISAC